MTGADQPPPADDPVKPPRWIEFAGRRWDVCQQRDFGNYFEASNVVVDVHGRLFLGIARHAGQWTAAQIALGEPLAHAEYALLVESPLDFPNNVVLSFALRRDDEHEIAIQLSPWWGRPSNAQFRIEDPERLPDGFLDTFRLPTDRPLTSHHIRWSPTSLDFACYDARPRFLRGSRLLHEAQLDIAIPTEGYQLVVGFWLFRGDAPGDNRDQRLWVRDVAIEEL